MYQQQQNSIVPRSRREKAHEVKRRAEAFADNPYALEYRRHSLPITGRLRVDDLPASESYPHMATQVASRGTMKVVKYSNADDRPIVLRVGLVGRPRPA